MGRLDGKIALITGGTSGIGEATVRLFALEGATTIIVGRNEQRGNIIKNSINEINGDSDFVLCDVTISREVDILKNIVYTRYGRLDILVNCAGIWDAVSLKDITDDFWEKSFKSNSTSIMYTTRAFYNFLEENHGNIVNVASIGGLQSHISGGRQYAYGASKAAAIQFSQLCALNFAPKVRVNLVCPGPTDTPIYTNKDYTRFYESIPMHRVGKPEETAKAILFLASEDASYITGTILTVDGGASIR